MMASSSLQLRWLDVPVYQYEDAVRVVLYFDAEDLAPIGRSCELEMIALRSGCVELDC
jgi:hypothetical protein